LQKYSEVNLNFTKKKKGNKYQYGHCVLDSTLNKMNEGKGIASRNPLQLKEGGDTEDTTRGEIRTQEGALAGSENCLHAGSLI